MKKYYDYYVNRRNTPHLDLYTKLIGMFYFWNGMNFILGSAYALSIGQKKLAVSGLVLGILMCSLIKDKTTDKRKNQRDLKAVIGDGIIYAICALGISYVLSFWLLLLVYILEMIYVAWVIFIYFKQQNGQRSRKQRRKDYPHSLFQTSGTNVPASDGNHLQGQDTIPFLFGWYNSKAVCLC